MEALKLRKMQLGNRSSTLACPAEVARISAAIMPFAMVAPGEHSEKRVLRKMTQHRQRRGKDKSVVCHDTAQLARPVRLTS